MELKRWHDAHGAKKMAIPHLCDTVFAQVLHSFSLQGEQVSRPIDPEHTHFSRTSVAKTSFPLVNVKHNAPHLGSILTSM